MRQVKQPPAPASAAGRRLQSNGGTAKKKPFAWQQRNVQLAIAPWAQDRERQHFVTANVFVAEELTPQYALTFTVTVQQQQPPMCVVRKVTKQHMANAFERSVSHTNSDFAQLKTATANGSKSHQPKPGIDDAIQQWLLQGKVAPTREEIVLWLLSRMILVSSTKEQEAARGLLICGEQGAECAVAMGSPAEQESRLRDHEEAHDDKGSDEECEELPAYDERNANENEDDEETSDMWEVEAMISNGDEHAAPEPQSPPIVVHKPQQRHCAWLDANLKAVQQSYDNSSAAFTASTATAASSKDLEVDNVVQTSDTHRKCVHLQATFSNKELLASETQPSTYERQQNSSSQFTFEPASTRTRRHSSSVDPNLSNAWTQDRKTFQLELHKSRKDIQATKELQRKTETIAHLRKQQLLLQTQRKLRAQDQKRDDSRQVTQLVADTLEYHELLNTLETQVKRTKISAKRDQERLAQTVRVVLGKGEKHIKGPILGSGPLSQIEIDAATVKIDRGGHEVDTFVYDLHGRRHSAEDAQSVLALGVFETAMLKIKRILDHSKGTESVLQTFRKFDTNRSGTLSREEFRNVLLANGVKLTGEQTHVFFQHFDPNRSGEIDYGELLWGFFNRRAFLKKWQLRKTKLSSREIKLLFYQYDRTGRGALSAKDFALAMDNIGFQVTESELKLLVLKFDANMDGFIDYHEFHAFVSNGEVEGANEEARQESSHKSRSYSVQSQQPCSEGRENEEESVERIVNELRALSETQTKIRQSIRK